MLASTVRSLQLRELRQKLLKSQHSATIRQIIPTELAPLDGILPQGGLPTASVVEWVSEQPGLSAGTLALRCARPFLREPGCLAVVDPWHEFHAAVPAGISLSRILVVRPAPARPSAGLSEALWSLEQIARCPGIRVAVCWLDRVSSTVLRRLQLAVEQSGVTVFLIRPATVLRHPSWSDLRLVVTVAPGDSADQRMLAVDLTSSRHAAGLKHRRALLKVDHETGAVSAISELADPASAASAAAE